VRGAVTPTVGTGYFTPLPVMRGDLVVDRFSIEVTADVANATLAVALFNDDPTGNYPYQMVLDGGTIVTGGVGTGRKDSASTGLAFALDPGLYWLFSLPLVASATVRGIGTNGVNYTVPVTPYSTSSNQAALTQTSLSATPSTAAPDGSTSTAVPLTHLILAAAA
jgi:hypothetical protein